MKANKDEVRDQAKAMEKIAWIGGRVTAVRDELLSLLRSLNGGVI